MPICLNEADDTLQSNESFILNCPPDSSAFTISSVSKPLAALLEHPDVLGHPRSRTIPPHSAQSNKDEKDCGMRGRCVTVREFLVMLNNLLDFGFHLL